MRAESVIPATTVKGARVLDADRTDYSNPPSSQVFGLKCLRCDWSGDPSLVFRCPRCEGALDAELDLRAARVRVANDPESVYADFLPVRLPGLVPAGSSRATTCRPAPRLGAEIGVPNLWIKDESEQPTGSTKDRLAAVVVAVFREFGIKEFVTASTGNTAIALARAVARDGQLAAHFFCSSSVVGVDELAELPGCRLEKVDGNYVDAIAAAQQFAAHTGVFAEGGFFSWARREGLKLAYLEAFDAMPEAPDVVVQAISSGMGMLAARKAAEEYVSVGRLPHIPKFLMVQQDSCAPMAHGWQQGLEELTPAHVVPDPRGLASAILLGDGAGSYRYLRDIARRSGGAIVDVSQEDLRRARGLLLQLEGLDVCYSSAATAAAIGNEVAAGRLSPESVVLLNLTGRYRG